MNDSSKDIQPADANDHRKEERRKVPAQGFAYISVVGWICRRERCRRGDDRFIIDPSIPNIGRIGKATTRI